MTHLEKLEYWKGFHQAWADRLHVLFTAKDLLSVDLTIRTPEGAKLVVLDLGADNPFMPGSEYKKDLVRGLLQKLTEWHMNQVHENQAKIAELLDNHPAAV